MSDNQKSTETESHSAISPVMSSYITIQKHFSDRRKKLYGKTIEDCIAKRKKYYPDWYQVVFCFIVC